MEAIGTLAGGIAHDFNNLLQSILGYTDLLLMRKKASDPDRQKLEIVHQAARDGADLVSRILAFSMKRRIQSSPHGPEPRDQKSRKTPTPNDSQNGENRSRAC